MDHVSVRLNSPEAKQPLAAAGSTPMLLSPPRESHLRRNASSPSSPDRLRRDSFLRVQLYLHPRKRSDSEKQWLEVRGEDLASSGKPSLHPLVGHTGGCAGSGCWEVTHTPLSASPSLDGKCFPVARRSAPSTPSSSPAKTGRPQLNDVQVNLYNKQHLTSSATPEPPCTDVLTSHSGPSSTSQTSFCTAASTEMPSTLSLGTNARGMIAPALDHFDCMQGSELDAIDSPPTAPPFAALRGLIAAVRRGGGEILQNDSPPLSPSKASPWRRTQSLDNIVEMIEGAHSAVMSEIGPELSVEGTQGTYFLKDSLGTIVGVFKPSDEEVCEDGNPRGLKSPSAALKTGVPPGEGWKREIAAYRLDHGHFAGVPETLKLEMPGRYFAHEGEGIKIGSFQRFVKHDGAVWDVAPGHLPVEEVHRIAVLDIRLCNSDRHGGNVLFARRLDGKITDLIPIDHGACAPTHLEDTEFDWLMWPQSREPFSTATLAYIGALDPDDDAAILRDEVGLCQAAVDNVRAATTLLQVGARRGLNVRAIGSLLRRPTLKDKGALEAAIDQVRGELPEGAACSPLDMQALLPHITAMVEHALAAT